MQHLCRTAGKLSQLLLRLAPAAVLAPFVYTEIVWAIALGLVVFGDLPTRWTLTGCVIVVGSGLYLLHRERVRGRS